jgi:CHASE3 domain sensor protein
MQWSIEKRINTGFAIALLVLGVIGGLAFWSTTQLISTAHWVAHTHQVIANLESLFADLSKAEAGQRGYIITGNEQYLEPYYLATASVNDTVREIRQLTSDNAGQQQRLQKLEPALEKRLVLLEKPSMRDNREGLQRHRI